MMMKYWIEGELAAAMHFLFQPQEAKMLSVSFNLSV